MYSDKQGKTFYNKLLDERNESITMNEANQPLDPQGQLSHYAPQQINIGDIIEHKFKRKLPRFVIRSIEKLIHQDEINYVLRKYGHIEGMAFIDFLMEYFGIHIKVYGKDRLPTDPRAMFVSNHPLGGLDGICLSHVIGTHYNSDIRYIVNDMLLFLHPFRNIFVPVNTLKGQSRNSVFRVNEALSSPYPVISFPAGICSRIINGKIQDLPWKHSFVKQALRSERNIVPIFFYGYNSRSFYNTELIRKKLGIKFNIGTSLLPREMFNAKGSNYVVCVGEPLLWENLKGAKLDAQAITTVVREKVYQLPEEFGLKTR